MKPDDFSRPAKLNEQIEALTSELERRQQAQRGLADGPDLRLTLDIRHAYQTESDDDQRSLERVLARLVGNEALNQPQIIFLPQASKTQERMSAMQNNVMNSSPQPKDKGKSTWTRRVGLIAAVLCIALLVGSFLTVLNATHLKPKTTTTVAQQATALTPTPQLKTGPVGTIVYEGQSYNNPMAWSPTGNRVAGAIGTSTFATWDGLTGTNPIEYQMPSHNSHNAVSSAAWSPDGSRVAFVTSDDISVFNARTGALLESLPLPQAPTSQNILSQGFSDLSWSPDGKYIATIYTLTTGTTIPKAWNPNPTGTQFVNQLYVWNLATNQVVKKVTSPDNQLAWSPTGKYLAIWNNDSTLRSASDLHLWDTTAWQITKTYSNVAGFAWSPDGSQMAMIIDGVIQIVSTGRGSILHTFMSKTGYIISTTLGWQPHGNSILFATQNTSTKTLYVSLWNIGTGSTYTFTQYQGASAQWSSDGKYVWMAAMNVKSPSATPNPGMVESYQVVWIAN